MVGAAVTSTVALVLVYTYIVLPLDLGLGLQEGYGRLWPLSFGIVTSVLWLALTLLVSWRISIRLAKHRSAWRTVWFATWAAAITLLTSYPLVVLYMYVSLDAVMASGQIGASTAVGRLYWLALAFSAIALVVAPISLAVLSARRTAEA